MTIANFLQILDALCEIIDSIISHKGRKSSVQIILNNHFKYKKCNDCRKFLMEQSNIVATRIKFLRKISDLRRNNDTRPKVYLDEVWVNQNHTSGYIWQNSFNTEGVKVLIRKGGRFIVCHDRSRSFELVKDSKLVFRCSSENSVDYHSQMNSEIFESWFVDMLH